HAVRCRRQARRGVASHEDFRMIRRILLAALTASTLAACSQSTPDNFSDGSSGYLLGGLEASGESQHLRLAQLPNVQSPPQQTGPARRIAVTRSFTLRLPGSDVAAVQERHLTECARLECTVLETRLDQLGDGRVSARASVRVTPERYPALAAVIT